MKRLSLIVALSMNIPFAIGAESTERGVSPTDANPECMERNGPDCIIKNQIVPPPAKSDAPPSVIAPPAPLTTPRVVPAVPPSSSTTFSNPPPTPTPENAPRFSPPPPRPPTVVAPDPGLQLAPGAVPQERAAP